MVNKKSCHKCAGILEKAHASIVAHCSVCRAGYHTIDCGMRYLAAGLDVESTVSKCPKCYKMCACSGGSIPCHTANVRLRGAANKKRRREIEEAKDGLHQEHHDPDGKVLPDTFLTSAGRFRSNKHVKQKTKVPIVVAQLINTNRDLQEQVRQLQATLSQCRCLNPSTTTAPDASSSSHHNFAPSTPPDWSDADDADQKEWDGMFFTELTPKDEVHAQRSIRPHLQCTANQSFYQSSFIVNTPPPPHHCKHEVKPLENIYLFEDPLRCVPPLDAYGDRAQ